MEQLIVGIVCLPLLLIGFAFYFRARKHRTEFGRSIRWYQVGLWYDHKNVTDAFTVEGARLNKIGNLLVTSGCLVLTMVLFISALL